MIEEKILVTKKFKSLRDEKEAMLSSIAVSVDQIKQCVN